MSEVQEGRFSKNGGNDVEITEVRIKLMEDTDDRLQAFCSITLDDCFVVRDLKIIDGTNGPFVAMPSRKLTCHCGSCGSKNHLRSNFCNQCGQKIRRSRDAAEQEGRAKLYADIAHPINSECREMIQSRVIREFEDELERAQQPGYTSRYDDDYDAGPESDEPVSRGGLQGPHRRPHRSQEVKSETLGESSDPQSSEGPEPPSKKSEGSFGAGIFDD